MKGHVTCLALSPDSVVLAAGYSDGSICLWDYQIAATSESDAGAGPDARAPEGMFRTSLAGHRTDVTSLSFSVDGALLVSGSNDNELIVWDVIAEKVIFFLIFYLYFYSLFYLLLRFAIITIFINKHDIEKN